MSNVYICIYKQASMQDYGVWGCSPRKFLEIKCSEIASGAILDKRRALVATISSNVWLSYMHLLSQLTSNLHERRY